MILEYNMRSAVSIESGEQVDGYYAADKDKHYILSWAGFRSMCNEKSSCFTAEACEIDPATLEPVRVEPKMQDLYGGPDRSRYMATLPHCPNCDKMLDYLKKLQFCQGCGMALDWNKYKPWDKLTPYKEQKCG